MDTKILTRSKRTTHYESSPRKILLFLFNHNLQTSPASPLDQRIFAWPLKFVPWRNWRKASKALLGKHQLMLKLLKRSTQQAAGQLKNKCHWSSSLLHTTNKMHQLGERHIVGICFWSLLQVFSQPCTNIHKNTSTFLGISSCHIDFPLNLTPLVLCCMRLAVRDFIENMPILLMDQIFLSPLFEREIPVSKFFNPAKSSTSGSVKLLLKDRSQPLRASDQHCAITKSFALTTLYSLW